MLSRQEINLDPNALSWRKNLVRIFYKDLWDHQDLSLVDELFHPQFTFRGSLGRALVGAEQFLRYLRSSRSSTGAAVQNTQRRVQGAGRAGLHLATTRVRIV